MSPGLTLPSPSPVLLTCPVPHPALLPYWPSFCQALSCYLALPSPDPVYLGAVLLTCHVLLGQVSTLQVFPPLVSLLSAGGDLGLCGDFQGVI